MIRKGFFGVGIDVSRLGPAAQRQVLEKMVAAERKRKFNNEPTMRGSIRFDSQKEARRYDALLLLLKAGKIHDLRLQPEWTLQEAYTTHEGRRVRAIRYRADFSYRKDGELVVEDVKSRSTAELPAYRMKRKMLQEKYGIEIKEVL